MKAVLACLLLTGCLVGSVGPLIGFGLQGTEHGPKAAGIQLGAEASAGFAFAEGTTGAYWIQSHGLAVAGRADLGWDSAYFNWDGRIGAVPDRGSGGRLGIGELRLADETEWLVAFEGNHSVRLTNRCQALSAHGGASFSMSVSLRINARGWTLALAPRIAGFLCPGSGG